MTLFVNHLKSQYASTEKDKKDALEKRRRQAQWIANMLQNRYGSDMRKGSFVVMGDFNAPHNAEELQPLLGMEGLENVVQTRELEIRTKKKTAGDADRWTYYLEDDKSTSQLDYILLSPTLSDSSRNERVIIERRGLADYADGAYDGERFPGVGPRDTEASDHCAVFTTVHV